jgi:hypothetical protein
LNLKLASGIARAAAAAAPDHAAEIAAAVAKERPTQYASIAYEVSYAVPGKDEQIVNAVISGVPNLKTFVGAAPKTPVAVTTEGAAVGLSTPQAVDVSPALADLVSAAPLIDDTARTLGIKKDDLLTAQLTESQTAAVNAKVNASKSSTVSATASSSAAAKGVPFVPGGGTQGEQKKAQPVVVTPGQDRDYSNNGNNGKTRTATLTNSGIKQDLRSPNR